MGICTNAIGKCGIKGSAEMTDKQMLDVLEEMLSKEDSSDQLKFDLFSSEWGVSKNGQLLMFSFYPNKR